jgi:Ser/Thr protein kinase RdoA (MazF antagonist)
VLAVLEHVPGRHPDPAVAEDMRRVGRALARAHRVIQECPINLGTDQEWPWQWVEDCVRTIPMDEQIRGAVGQVWSEAREMVAARGLAITLIHSDPGLESFLLNDAEPARDGLIDWATPLRGPTGYDLASLQVLLSSHDARSAGWCIEGYLAECPEVGDQLPLLPLLVRVRWMAHVIYFASRIDRGIDRGSPTADANETGLAEAYSASSGPPYFRR